MIFTARFFRPSNPRRGIVTAMIVMSMIFISAAVLSLTLLFATEARRTRAVKSGTQLRQLLLAAAPIAADELRRHGSAPRDVPIPTPLASAQLTLQITPLDANKVQVRAVAKTAGAASTQTLIFAKSANDWQLESATLSGQP